MVQIDRAFRSWREFTADLHTGMPHPIEPLGVARVKGYAHSSIGGADAGMECRDLIPNPARRTVGTNDSSQLPGTISYRDRRSERRADGRAECA